MASKSKELKAEQERLDRKCRKKINIISELKCGLKRAEDRALCTNWIDFLSSYAKDEARVRECVLDQMERQLRKGPLTRPFTTHVYNRDDLHELLDEEGRQRLRRSSQPEVATSKQSQNSICWKPYPFVWRQRVKHLSTLEEQYRREEQEQWLLQQPKEVTANQEVGVQVELPPWQGADKEQDIKKLDIKKQDIKKQEIKKQEIINQEIQNREIKKQEIKKQEIKKQETKNREIKKQEIKKQDVKKQDIKKQAIKKRDIKKQEINKQDIKKQESKDQEPLRDPKVAERRKLDRQRRAETQQLRERHLLEQQLKVNKQRDYERNLINKRREAQSPPRKEYKTTQDPKLHKPVKEVKKLEAAQEAGKEVKCKTCHSVTTCVRCEVLEQQAVLRAEDIKKKVMAYEELKQYHSRRALEERERLKMEQLEREAKQDRAPGGHDPFDGRTKPDEVVISRTSKEDQNQKQEELENREETCEKSERGREENLERNSQRELEEERKRMQEEFEMETKAREKLERRRQADLLRKYERQLERERNKMLGALEKIQEARAESERKRDEDLQKMHQRQLENERKRMQEEFEKENKAREEAEQGREEDTQRMPERKGASDSPRNIDDSRYEFLSFRKKKLMHKWAKLREMYKPPARGLNPAQENARRKKELRAKKQFLKEITYHTDQLRKEINIKSKSQKNLLHLALEMKLWEDIVRNEEQQPQGNPKSDPTTENSMANAKQICKEIEAPSNPYEEVQRDLEKLQNQNHQLTKQYSDRCLEIERQKRLARDEVLSELFAECSKKAEKNWRQANVLRDKCLREIVDVDVVMKRICATTEEDASTRTSNNQRLQSGSSYQNSSGRKSGSFDMLYKRETCTASSSSHGEEADTESIGRESSISAKVLYKREPWPASSLAHAEEEPQRYPADIFASYCTQTGRKHCPHICRNAGIRRKREPLHCRSFRQLLRVSRPTELSPRVLTARNCILGRKLYVAKKTALNNHIKKSLTREAGRLIDYLGYDKAKAQPSTKSPKNTFKILVRPLLQNLKDVSPRVMETISLADDNLETYVKELFEAHAAHNHEQHEFDEPSKDLYHREHLVSDLLEDFTDVDALVNEVLRRIDRHYKDWRAKQLDF